MQYDVTYICDAPSNSNVSKAVGRINKNLLKRSTEKYYKKNVKPIIEERQFDYLLLIGGMTFAFSPEMVSDIKNKNPNTKFVMYQWDSEKNLPYSTHIHKFFDRIFSFDLNDCKEDAKYSFLPLFYTQHYEKIGQIKEEQIMYDCSYVGTAHPKKFHDINQISEAIKDIMPRQLIYHYMPSKLKFLYHKLLAPEYKGAKYSSFKTEKLSTEAIIDIIKQSKCVLDAPQGGQTGLTIRTIECLGAQRKLITTNEDVVNYDFYNPKNIYIFKQGKIDIHDAFFINNFEPIQKEVYEKYSLRNWLRTMLDSYPI